MAAATRPYQLTVWGASGFVGRLVCERLATEYPNQLRIALAGRDRGKLDLVRKEMVHYDASFKDVELFVAEADDKEAIDNFTKSSDVIISCAGPYRKYSSQVVASSAENGTHYVDLTAEIPWVRSNVRKYHEIALKNKSKIVHFCGFDSVPMDLGTLLVVDTIRKRFKTGCRLVEQYVVKFFGGMSGGTAASGLDIFASASPAEKAAMEDPYCLTPAHLDSPSGSKFEGIKYNEDLKSWIVPSLFSKFNTPVIQRSNALAKEPYGKSFIYREGFKAPNLLVALIGEFVGNLSASVFKYSFMQGLVQSVAPKPGSGPSLDMQRNKGFWRLMFVGYPDNGSEMVTVKLEDNHGDPGYWSTSKMLLECALSLIFDKDKVDQAAALEGGVLTPAAAFGLVPLERLRNSGFVVDVVP